MFERVFLKAEDVGGWQGILRLQARSIYKRYYVGQDVIRIDLADKTPDWADDYVHADDLNGFAYADITGDPEAWNYVSNYLYSANAEDTQLAVMADRLIDNAFDPTDCPDEECINTWDGSNWETIALVAEHSNWDEVTERWEGVEEIDWESYNTGTYILYKLQNESYWLVDESNYQGSLPRAHKVIANNIEDALQEVIKN